MAVSSINFKKDTGKAVLSIVNSGKNLSVPIEEGDKILLNEDNLFTITAEGLKGTKYSGSISFGKTLIDKSGSVPALSQTTEAGLMLEIVSNFFPKASSTGSTGGATDASDLTNGTLDGNRLPAMSTTKKGGVPATGSPSGKYLKDDGTWATPAGDGGGSLPSDTSHAYDVLTTDGAGTASWTKPGGVYNILAYGAIPDVNSGPAKAANKTAIEAAIAAVLASGSGTVLIPQGKFYHDPVEIPAVSGAGGWKYLEILGQVAPSPQFGTMLNFAMPDFTSALICEDVTGPAIKVLPYLGGFGFFTLAMRKVDIRTQDPTPITAVHAGYAGQLVMEDVSVSTNVYNVDALEPTANTKGIITPYINNNAWSYLDRVVVTGFAEGIEVNEHVYGGYVVVASNIKGLALKAAYHASYFVRVGAYRNQLCVSVDGAHRFSIAQLDLEYGGVFSVNTNWQDSVYDLNDPGSLGQGSIIWANVLSGVGISSHFVRNGGYGIAIKESGHEDDWTKTASSAAGVINSLSSAGGAAAAISSGTNALAELVFQKLGVNKWSFQSDLYANNTNGFGIYNAVDATFKVIFHPNGNVYFGKTGTGDWEHVLAPGGGLVLNNVAGGQAAIYFQQANGYVWQMGVDVAGTSQNDFYIKKQGANTNLYIPSTQNLHLGGEAISAPAIILKNTTGLPTYANDAAADADATLPSLALYKITGSRVVYQKP